MTRMKSIPLALAAILALGGAVAFAQTAPQLPAKGAAQTSQSTLAEAVRVAERATGGRARKAEMESDRGADAWEIKTVSKERSAKVRVEPASGKVVRVDAPGFLDSIASLFDAGDRRKDQAALGRLEASPMTLAAAIAAAERETGGRAVKASLKTQHGQTLFEVGVVKDLVLHKVRVDPASGKVVAVARSKSDDDD
jgi:uncharacterized membrane protein YkoI